MNSRTARLLTATLALVLASPVVALDHLVIKRDGVEKRVSGKVMVTAEDGGLMLLAWPVTCSIGSPRGSPLIKRPTM
jgi:hypothetical protein